jgi:hypothetical protein
MVQRLTVRASNHTQRAVVSLPYLQIDLPVPIDVAVVLHIALRSYLTVASIFTCFTATHAIVLIRCHNTIAWTTSRGLVATWVNMSVVLSNTVV